MLVATFFDPRHIQLDLTFFAIDQTAIAVFDFKRVAGENGEITFFQIGDLICERCQRNRVRAYKHLTIAVTNCQRRSFARGNHQILFAFKQERQRKGTIKAGHGFGGGFNGRNPFAQEAFSQKSYGFGVGLGLKVEPLGLQLFAQLFVVFNNAVVNNSHIACTMGVCIVEGWGTVGGPAGVTDAGFPGKWFMHQRVRQIHQLPGSAATPQFAVIDRCNACAVVATVFKAFQPLHQNGGRLVIA